MAEAKRRPRGKAPELITTDELAAYKMAIEATFSKEVPAPPRILHERRLPDDLNYATVHKNRENDRVVSVERRQIIGSPDVDPGVAEWGRSGPQCEEGPQDLPVQQGLGGPQSDDVPDDVRLQLLLAGPDLAGQGRRAEVAAEVIGDDGRIDRSSMDLVRVVYPPGSSISLGHHQE